MTRKEAKKAAEVMLAYAEGKEIEYYSKASNEWKSCNSAYFNWDGDIKYSYRIKPEPTYHPFKDAEECWQEMQKHQPFGWVRREDLGNFLNINYLQGKSVSFNGDSFYSLEMLLDNGYTFADGAPFGVKEDAE